MVKLSVTLGDPLPRFQGHGVAVDAVLL